MEKKEEIFNKWKSVLDTVPTDTESNTTISSMTHSTFPSILPIAMQVASRTIGMDLVNVQPMGNITDEMIREVNSENRDRKIDSITDDKEYEEMKIQDHPDYIEGPKGKLFYIDFKYGPSQSNSNI